MQRDDLDIARFRALLEERLAAILDGRQARQDEGAPVELDQAKVGRLSRMDAMQQQAMARANTRRSELEVQRLRAALGRIQAGDYGCCIRCEEEIAVGRLLADPAAPLCIDCARSSEQGS